MALKSTLAEIHAEVAKYFYAIFSGLDPEIWVNQKQVFYCPVATFRDGVRLLQERDKESDTNKNIKYPFATVTRGDFDLTDDLTRVPFHVKFVDDTPDEDNPDQPVTSYKLHRVKIIYNLLVHHNSLDNLERISENLVFTRRGSTRHDYESTVVPNLETGFQIVYSDFPQYESIPDHEELLRGKGSIYSLRLPFRVDGVIARSSSDEKRILEAIAKIKDLKNHSIEYGETTITD